MGKSLQLTTDAVAHLQKQWADMWNGNQALASGIVVPEDFTVHLTDIGLLFGDQKQIRHDSSAQVRDWVQRIRSRYASLVYSTKAGPFVNFEQNTITTTCQAEGVFACKTSRPDDIAGNTFTIIFTLSNLFMISLAKK